MPRLFFLRRGGWLAAFYEEMHLYDAELAKALLSINLSLFCIQGLLSGLIDIAVFYAQDMKRRK